VDAGAFGAGWRGTVAVCCATAGCSVDRHISRWHLRRRCLLPLPHLLGTVFVQGVFPPELLRSAECQTGSVRRPLLCLLRGVLHRLALVLGLPFLLLLGVVPL